MNRPFDFNVILKKYNLLLLLVVFIVVSSILSPNFLTPANLLNMLQQCSVIGIIAIGMTLVIIIGGIDLSVGAVAAFAGMITSVLVSEENAVWISIVAGMLAACLVGVFTGFLASVMKLPDFIVSMASMQIARGLALLVTKGSPVFGLCEEFHFIGGARIGGVFPVSALIWIGLTVAFAVFLKYTVFGRSIYAVGANREASELSGIKATRNKMIVYIICAALAGFAGIMTASWLKSGQPNVCTGYELNAIAACVIGGASLAGGIGGVIGTFGGVILLQIITNIFNLVGLSSFYQQIAMGFIIVLALLLNKFVVSVKTETERK